jgi:hypothetical protein
MLLLQRTLQELERAIHLLGGHEEQGPPPPGKKEKLVRKALRRV